MKYSVAFGLILLGPFVYAQSETTQQLHKEHEDAFYMFFYKNTLHMINQGDNEEFARLIKGIDRMKYLRIQKEEEDYSEAEVQSLMRKYQEEDFEEMMSMRMEGNDVKVYIKEKDKITQGLIMLINDNETLSILDIKGSVPLNEVMSIYDKVKSLN